MTQANFQACMNFTLSAEGGYCDVPGDAGGATNMGVTQATLSNWLGRPANVEDVQALTRETAEAIYRANYWDAVNGDGLPPGVDLMVFDFGVNVGAGTSAKRLQALIGVETDGEIGPLTLRAVAMHDVKWLITTLGYSQQAYYTALNQPEFIDGWLNRTRNRTAMARTMA